MKIDVIFPTNQDVAVTMIFHTGMKTYKNALTIVNRPHVLTSIVEITLIVMIKETVSVTIAGMQKPKVVHVKRLKIAIAGLAMRMTTHAYAILVSPVILVMLKICAVLTKSNAELSVNVKLLLVNVIDVLAIVMLGVILIDECKIF